MKKGLIFLFFYFWAVILSGQSSAEKLDNEKIVEAKIAFDKYSDCPAAKNALDQVSSKGKESMLFLFYASQVYECLKDYENAIESYEKLNKLKGDSIVDEKIIELRYLLNKKEVEQRDLLNKKEVEQRDLANKKISACKKCHGTGEYSEESSCSACDGEGIIVENKVCSGFCGGKGTYKTVCPKCSGNFTGCTCSFGMVTETCNKCNGSGSVDVETKCRICKGKGGIKETIECDHSGF